MKAIGYFQPAAIDAPESLLDLELPAPAPGPRDLLVEVRAIAVNPVDVKVRASRPAADAQSPVLLGWDAVGIVQAVGAEVQGFVVGDRVWYAGEINRPGSYAQLQCVDYRIASHAPAQLSDAEAAALPLTGITAWELLFERLQVQSQPERPVSLLVTGAAGGVGSILLQLARRLPHLTLIATASRPAERPDAVQYLRELGAHHVIDHSQPLAPQIAALNAAPLRYTASLTHTPQHFQTIVDAMEPQGRVAVIDDFAPDAINFMAMKGKSLSLHWEMMFVRPLHQTHDIAAVGALLAELARGVDKGELRSTLGEVLGPINAATLKRAHTMLESQHTRGKLVLQGWA
ncbi:zinc-binding alcohol dehydrogenase family protein [Paucibacter sp. APW11]|uniref:Zinc-type alcohol dehydrogenase-like protein n=1 Tax=Roseateles aquae TaxID=3077235 RepID=A0ABU3PCQ3_9BURK|nr:zinc-binding alcohol dehydrogenase family protein [Paucibacter sp. APW11]MDT9000318.1 zinc-binding alcohol dehydrogenase family protein [Paucibacter sp. APW11]